MLVSIALALVSWIAPGEELRLPLRVLYAGNENTPYTESYVKFLENHASTVRAIGLSKLTVADLKDVDVLVIGGEVEERNSKGEFRSLKNEPFGLALSQLQGFPTVLVGGQGGFVSDSFEMKTSWTHG